jgi:hypothetical protein
MFSFYVVLYFWLVHPPDEKNMDKDGEVLAYRKNKINSENPKESELQVVN